jgi:hypothetical protein
MFPAVERLDEVRAGRGAAKVEEDRNDFNTQTLNSLSIWSAMGRIRAVIISPAGLRLWQRALKSALATSPARPSPSAPFPTG